MYEKKIQPQPISTSGHVVRDVSGVLKPIGKQQCTSNISCACLLSPLGKMSTGYRCPGFSTYSWDLKYGSMFFTDLLWLVISPALVLKTIPDLLDANSTLTGIAYIYLIAPHTYHYMGYVRHVGHAARSSKNHMWFIYLFISTFVHTAHIEI